MKFLIKPLQQAVWLGFMVLGMMISGYGQILPGVQLVQKQESANQANYTFKKGNNVFKLQLKLAGNKVNARVLGGQNNVLGKMSISATGSFGKVVDVISTQNRIFFLWVFALQRVENDGGSLKLLSIDADVSSGLLTCLQACEKAEDLKALAIADQKDQLVERIKKLNSDSDSGGCVDIIICTEETLSEFEQCVEDCYEAHGDSRN